MSTQLWESGDVCSLGVCLCSSCILIKHLRRSRCKSVHELLPESSENVRTGQTSMRELPVRSSESHHIHCCESQSRVLNHAHRRDTCILPCKGPEACADTITSVGQNASRCWEDWTQPAIGSVIGKSTSKAGAFNMGSARRICFTMEGTEFQS